MFWGSRAPVARVHVTNSSIAKMLLFIIILMWDSNKPTLFLSRALNFIYCRVKIKAALELLILKFTIISDKVVEMMLRTNFSNTEFAALYIFLSATFCTLSSATAKLFVL